mgnify:FL=1
MSPLRPVTRNKRIILTFVVFFLLLLIHIPLFMSIRFSPKVSATVSKSGNNVVMSIKGGVLQKKKTETVRQKSINENKASKVVEQDIRQEESESIEETSDESTEESSGGTGDAETLYEEGIEDVRMKIAEQIQKHKLYPMAARKRALEGDVELAFTVLTDGTVEELCVVKGNVNALLKDAAILSVKKSVPFDVNISSPLPMKITLRYELNG